MTAKATCEQILGYFLPHDQEVIRFMARENNLNVDKLNGKEMLALIENFDASEEWQAAFKARQS